MSVTVSYTGTNVIRTVDQLVQWTVGQTLTVVGLTFSGKLYARCEILGKSMEALTSACEGASGDAVECPISDDVLSKDGTLVVNLADVTDDKATIICTVQVPVRKAAKPTDWIPDPDKVITIDKLIKQVEEAVEKANAATEDAKAATAGAEKVNASLSGTKLTVTSRDGTSTSADVQGPQGEQGPEGPQGPQGEQGETDLSKAWKNMPVESSDALSYGDNLNSISAPCTRFSSGSSVTSGISNVPSGVTDQFVVYTIAADQDPYRLLQVLYSLGSAGAREFTRTGAGSSWTEWNEIHTPVRGVDYWTDADIAVIKAYIDAQGVLPPDIGYEGLSKLIKSGEASRYLPVGSQIITELSGNDFDVPSFAWDVVHHFDGSDDDHPLVTLESGEQVKGMMLQAHRTLPWATVWEPKQAAIAVTGDMPAGTYHFTVKITATWGSGIAAAVGSKTYQFTTTKAMAKGAQLVWSGDGYSTKPTAMTLQAYASGTSTTVVESCTVTEGSSGTDLGTTVDNTVPTNSQNYAMLNNPQRSCYGSNRWKTSQERVALNETGAIAQGGDGFSRTWNLVGKTGLLGCLPEDFVSVLGNVARSQELHPWDGGAVETVYDKMFPISAREHYFNNYLYASSDGYKAEGVPLDYWKQLAVASGRASTWSGWNTYPELITYDSVALTTARYVWLRSAHRYATYATSVGCVSTSGGVATTYAYAGRFAAPACIIV